MAGIYFHIPFCKRICAYCDFYKSADRRRMPEVLDAMHRELGQRRDYLRGDVIRTRYFGGGTPSLLGVEQVAALLDRAAELFDCSQVEETTLEANPDDLSPSYLTALRKVGVDRLSIGVQSFDDDCLRLMNRRHTAAEAVAAVKAAQAAGFENITIDLIFGVPGFGGEKLEHSLDLAISLGVQHVSAYHLTVEPHTRFGRMAAAGQFVAVDEAVSEAEYARVDARLVEAGFEHYEISNFAQAGYRARHNAAYWHGERYLGIGAAAHSFDGEERHWNVASVEEYLNGVAPEAELLTERDRFNEYVMTRLRTAEGIALDELALRFGNERKEALLHAAQRWLQTQTLMIKAGYLAIPVGRMLLSDAVIEELFEV